MACSSGNTTSETTSADNTETAATSEAASTENKPTFEYKELANVDSDQGPKTKLYIALDGKKAEGPEVSMELKDGPYQSGAPNPGIPKTALAVCGGFWAGLQLDIYLMQEGSDYVLYESAQDESTTEPVVTKLKTFKYSDFK